MALRVGLLILGAWMVVAVPVALLVGRVLAASDRSVADEAAAVLRRARRRGVPVLRVPRYGTLAALAGVALVLVLDAPSWVPSERISTEAAPRAGSLAGSAREERRRTPRLPPLRISGADAPRLPAAPPAPAPPDGTDVSTAVRVTPTFPPPLAPWLSRAIGVLCDGTAALAGPCPTTGGGPSPTGPALPGPVATGTSPSTIG